MINAPKSVLITNVMRNAEDVLVIKICLVTPITVLIIVINAILVLVNNHKEQIKGSVSFLMQSKAIKQQVVITNVKRIIVMKIY